MHRRTSATFTPSAWCRGESAKRILPNSRPSGRLPRQKPASSGNCGIAHRNGAGAGFLRRRRCSINLRLYGSGLCFNLARHKDGIGQANPLRCNMAAITAGTDNLVAFLTGLHGVPAATNRSIRRKHYNLNLTDSYDKGFAKHLLLVLWGACMVQQPGCIVWDAKTPVCVAAR